MCIADTVCINIYICICTIDWFLEQWDGTTSRIGPTQAVNQAISTKAGNKLLQYTVKIVVS